MLNNKNFLKELILVLIYSINIFASDSKENGNFLLTKQDLAKDFKSWQEIHFTGDDSETIKQKYRLEKLNALIQNFKEISHREWEYKNTDPINNDDDFIAEMIDIITDSINALKINLEPPLKKTSSKETKKNPWAKKVSPSAPEQSLTEAERDFKEKCKAAGGTFTQRSYYNETCHCGSHQKRYFNFKYSKCIDNDQIVDIEKNTAPLVSLKSVTDFASLLNSYEKNICYADYETLKNGALLVLKNAMEKLNIAWQESSVDNNDFNNLFLKYWKLILDALDKHVKEDPDYDIFHSLYPDESTLAEDTLSRIRLALNNGLISLPVLENMDELFRFSAIKNGLLIGVAPITIQFKSIAEVQKNYEKVHPFRHYFVRSAAHLAKHDALHAELMSRNLLRLGLIPKADNDWYFSEYKCRTIATILDKLSKTKIENNTAAKTLWAPLYYYLHEDQFYLHNTSPFIVSEFIFELWQAGRQKSLPEIILGKNTEENKNYLRDLCHQIYEKIYESPIINFDFLHDFITPFTWLAVNSPYEESTFTKENAFLGITSRLKAICALNFEIKSSTQKQIEPYKYNLLTEVNKALKNNNFEKDFGNFHADFLKLFEEFMRVGKELVTSIDSQIWNQWHLNEDHRGLRIK